MKRYWKKATPLVEGWYWCKFLNKRKKYTLTPAFVTIFKDGTRMVNAGNTTFIEGPNHGGWGLRWEGQLDPSVRFGDHIPEPKL